MTMYGADVDQLRQMARSFSQVATSLDTISAGLRQASNSAPWRGMDAERFRAVWENTHQRQLASAAEALREGASALLANADQQEEASSGTGGSIASTVGGGSTPSSPSGTGSTEASAVRGAAGTTGSQSARSQQTAEFVQQWEGKPIDADGHFGAQCFDVFRMYSNDVVGAPKNIATDSIRAADIYHRYEVNGVSGFYDQIPVGSGLPQPGDIVVFDAKSPYGAYGHVGLVTSVANDGTLGILEQNYDGRNAAGYTSTPAAVRYHDPANSPVLGFLRPKSDG